MASPRPVVTEYLDYRSYLKDYFTHQKATSPSFSLRSFARNPALKLASSSFITALLQGKRNLSQHLRLKFAKALKLDQAEAEFFDFLVQFNQAKSVEEKNYFFTQLSKYRDFRAKLLEKDQYRFFTRWYYTVIWNYFGLDKAEKHPAQIARHILPNLSPAEVEDSISLLMDLGLIKKMANGYAVTDRHLVTDKADKFFLGLMAKPFHQEFLRLASEALDRFPAEARQYNAMAFSVSDKGYAAIKQRIISFRHEIREIIDRDEGMNQVGILNIQLFPGAKLT